MATTTNYSWTTPDDTDLVKDGAAAIRTLGSAIDTSFAADQGDLLLGGTSDIFEPLAIGAAATVLTSDGTTASWAAPAGGGKVLQVVQGTLTSNASTTSATYVDSGLSVSITPSSASSKVYVIANFWGYVTRSGSQVGSTGQYNLVRTSTQLQQVNSGATSFASTNDPNFFYTVAFSYLDSPATTSATTYKVQFLRAEAANTTLIGASATNIASIVAMEIGA